MWILKFSWNLRVSDPKFVEILMPKELQGCKCHNFGEHLKAILSNTKDLLGAEPCSSQIIVS